MGSLGTALGFAAVALIAPFIFARYKRPALVGSVVALADAAVFLLRGVLGERHSPSPAVTGHLWISYGIVALVLIAIALVLRKRLSSDGYSVAVMCLGQVALAALYFLR